MNYFKVFKNKLQLYKKIKLKIISKIVALYYFFDLHLSEQNEEF